MLHAFAAVAAARQDLHLVMAGPEQPAYGATLRGLAARLGIAQRITWTGMLSGAEKWGAYRAADVFMLPSHQENFGIVVAEAMACGLPVLISNKVNIWREVRRDEAGLVAEDDVAGATHLLKTWLALSDEQRARMSSNALRCFPSVSRGSEKVQAGTQNSDIAKLAQLNFRLGLGQCSLESNLFGGRSIKINGIIYLETWGGWSKIINGRWSHSSLNFNWKS